MSKELIVVSLFFWLTSSAYVIHYDYKRKRISFGSIFVSLLLGPLLALFVKDNVKEENVEQSIRNYMNSDEHIRARGFTIPPPPQSHHGNNLKIDYSKKSFKFFQRND